MVIQACEYCGNQPQKVLYSIPEAARLLSTGEAYCWRLARAGMIRTVRVGRRRLVAYAEIERFAELRAISAG